MSRSPSFHSILPPNHRSPPGATAIRGNPWRANFRSTGSTPRSASSSATPPPPIGEDIVISWSIKELAEKYRDQHIGELNHKTDKQRDGWAVELELHHATSVLIDALEAQYALQEANQPYQPIGIQLQLNERTTGNVKAYLFTKITTEEELSGKNRKDRLTYKLSCDAERRELVR
jgi:hypothetical protein